MIFNIIQVAKKTCQSMKKIAENIKYSCKYTWHYSKLYFLTYMCDCLIKGLVDPAVLLLTARLYTMLGEQPWFNDALFVELSLTLAIVVRALWDFLFGNSIWPALSQRLHYKVQSDLFKKARTFELAKFDDPEFYNNYILAMQYSDAAVTGAIGNFSRLLQYALNFSATLALLVYIDFGAMAVLLISSVISMFISAKLKKMDNEMRVEYAPIMRRGQYIDRVYRQADFSKELRLSNLSACLNRMHTKYVSDHIVVSKKYGKKKSILAVLDQMNSIGVYMSVIAMTLYKLVVLGTVTIGGFTVIINANRSFRDSLVLLADMITNLSSQSEQLDKVRNFMEHKYEGCVGELPVPGFESIELLDVCFGYDGGEDVLHNVSFRIRRGEKIAIVGYNGAGKSTLIKLLMRLYEPRSGCILYNGVNAAEYNIESYRSRFGAVFQDVCIFAATVAENVLGDEFKESDRPRVLEALHRATFDKKLAELDNGLETMLTREFDDNGTNLSGGEAQKIAIAHVFAGDFDVIIMDEPSAALDPIAEYELNEQIARFASDKTVIFISHRLSTTRHADRIYMFEDGRVVEHGSHDELMRQGGKYAEMFTVQAEKYVSESQ